MYKKIKFTRENLYKMVWERPVLAIAKEIGVSDVAVAKACRKAGIPLPIRGHWAIVKSGKVMKVPPLPKPKPDQSDSVWFTVLENPVPKLPKLPIPVGSLIDIPTELLKPHHLVIELKSAVKGKEEYKGVIPLNYEHQKILRVRTSVAQLERALILMDVLIKQFEDRGYKVRISEKNGETELVLKEGVVTFRLDERTRKTMSTPLPQKSLGRQGEHDYESWRPAYVLVGTGEFTLEFGKYQIRSCQNTWKDRVDRPIEAQLHEIMAVLPLWEAELLEGRLKREEDAARAREAEARRIAAARAEEVLRLQRVKLINQLLSWERAERLRRFIVAFELKSDQSPEAQAWLEWANLQIQELDPLCSNLKALTDLKVPLSDYFTGRGSWEKQPRNWWYFDPKGRPIFESIEDPEEGSREVSTSNQSNGSGTEPTWHPNQWYTRLNR